MPRPTYADAMANLVRFVAWRPFAAYAHTHSPRDGAPTVDVQLEASRDSKLRVNKVQVTGLGITRDEVVEAVIQDVLHAQVRAALAHAVQDVAQC